MNQPKAYVKLELLVQRKVHFFKRTLKIFFSIIICKMAGKLLPCRTFTMLPACFNTYGGWPRVRFAVIADGT